LLRQSLNYKSLARGESYPLFYDTLFSDLRAEFTKAAVAARKAKRRIWAQDLSIKGVTAKDQTDLEQHTVVFPKLFRRLTSCLATGAAGLDGFLPWVKADKEQVLDLTSNNFTHFDTFYVPGRPEVRARRRPTSAPRTASRRGGRRRPAPG
jgi:hypothetical protein